MASVDKFIPIVIYWETSVKSDKLTGSELFAKAKKKGWSDDPCDNGGATMVGVTLGTYKTYCKKIGKKEPSKTDLKNISYDEWRDILKTMYWDKMNADGIDNQSIANLCVNSVWGSGTSYIKIIQKVLGVTADGIVGKVTLGKINGWIPQKDLFNKLWERRRAYFYSIAPEGSKNRKWLKGWFKRLNSFTFVPESGLIVSKTKALLRIKDIQK